MDLYRLAVRCVDVAPNEVHLLTGLYDHDREIKFPAFAHNTVWKPLANRMGYVTKRGAKGMRLSQDTQVRFYRSRWGNKPCYHMVHSQIDFIFLANVEEAYFPENIWN
jgi:hypothetical protein